MTPVSPSIPFASLGETAAALRRRDFSAVELTEVAIARHEALGSQLKAYKCFDTEGARTMARAADRMLASGDAPPLCGIPISVKDLYGVTGLPTFVGSARELPRGPWSRDAWLVAQLRAAGAVIVGKTHMVEFAYGGVGLNPHWETPLNPWDPGTPRIPGGSSSGAGVSLHEGSAMIALASDTGGSIRIPAAFTGVVGHKTTRGRWSTDGVVPLSTTFDTVGALTLTVADSVYFFGSVDPRWGDPVTLREELVGVDLARLRIAVPECTIWEACQPDVADVLRSTIDELASGGATVERVVGTLLDDAVDLYMTGGIGKTEFLAFLTERLPEWIDLLHPTVGHRVRGADTLTGMGYKSAHAHYRRLAAFADTLFGDADVLALPANLITPPPVSEVADDLDRYVEVNYATLRPTCPANLLDLCAISLPVGLDDAGMPVGLQLLARGGDDEALLGAALAIEQAIGTARDRLGRPAGADQTATG